MTNLAPFSGLVTLSIRNRADSGRFLSAQDCTTARLARAFCHQFALPIFKKVVDWGRYGA